MEDFESFPSRAGAEELLQWAYNKNPGRWMAHCQVAARVAETVARKAGMDGDRAYISGLLHDIGRYEGVRGMHHIYAGYELLKRKGYGKLAEICLTHSFPYQDFEAYIGERDCSPEETAFMQKFLNKAVYNDYDKLIQLCDSLCLPQGLCLMEKRLLDVVMRYGFNVLTLKKWESCFALKSYFDERSGGNIYDLFYDEVREVTFIGVSF